MTSEREERVEREMTRYARRFWIGLLVSFLAVVGAAVGYALYGVDQANGRTDAEHAERQQDRAAASRDITTLRSQVKSLGGTPAVTAPPAEHGASGVDVAEVVRQVLRDPSLAPRDGRDGKDAAPPSDAQVQAAVATVCARMGCGPSDAQVATQVASALAAHPPPAGADGADGAPGQNGADGAQGAEGPTGPAGPEGRPGTGVADISPVTQDGATCTITITLTDGTTRDLTWTCQPAVVPTPDPTTPTPGLRLPLGGS